MKMRKTTSLSIPVCSGLLLGAALLCGGEALAQTPASQPPTATSPGWAMPTPPPGGAAPHYDLNTPVLPTSQGGVYDMNVSATQNGPPGTIVMTAPPAPVFDVGRALANTHGYVSSGVSTHNGHYFEGGVSVPIVPGSAYLDMGLGTGQEGGYPPVTPGGKKTTVTYDSYYAGLALHPTDDLSAYIGITGARVHSPGPYAYPYANPYSVP